MEMLSNIKNFLNAKHFLGPINEGVSTDYAIDYDAGAQILSHFQKEWEELHQQSEQNAERAERVADSIAQLHAAVSDANGNIAKITRILTASPNMKDTIAGCVKQLSELNECFELVEKELVEYEDLIERCELEQWKQTHQQQLALYQDKKMNHLEMAQNELAMKHAQVVEEFEQKRRRALQERQQVFQDAFKSDLETYKAIGSIPKINVPRSQPSALLEEIQLDMDDKELNDFLNDSK